VHLLARRGWVGRTCSSAGCSQPDSCGRPEKFDTQVSAIARSASGNAYLAFLATTPLTGVAGGERVIEAARQWNEVALTPYHLRSPDQIAAFFEGLELVEPVVVPCPRWRPDPYGIGRVQDMDVFCALGRK
jgi:hypothetical protein